MNDFLTSNPGISKRRNQKIRRHLFPGLSDYAFVIILPVIIYFMFVCILSIYNMMSGPKCILPLTWYEQKSILYITTYSVKIISSFFTKFSLLFSDILFRTCLKNQISSYISISNICAVSTMLVPESMLHFWMCRYASSSVIWFFSIRRRLAFEI